MSEDEVVVFLICAGIAAVLWIRWYWRAVAVSRLVSRDADRITLYTTPLLCVALLTVLMSGLTLGRSAPL